MRTKVLILVMAIFCSCIGKKPKDTINSGSITRIDLLSESKSTMTKLSECASSVEYIPLQTTKNSLLGEFTMKIVSVEDKIYIQNSGLDGEIMCFDITGKFLFKLQNLGRGPEEYSFISDFDVSSDNKILTVLSYTDRKLITYNISDTGYTFRNSLSLKDYIPLTVGLVPGTYYSFLAIEPWNITAPYYNLVISPNGDTIQSKPNYYGSRLDSRGSFVKTRIVYSNEGVLCFKELFSDTVFNVDIKNNSFKPRIIFDTHGTSVTPEMWGNPDRTSDHVTGIFGIYETIRFVLYHYSENNVHNCRLFDKKTEKIYNLDIGTFNETIANIPRDVEKIKLMDDLCGGPGFNQDIQDLNSHSSNGKLYTLVDAITLKKYVSSEDFKNAKGINPNNKNELKNLADSINETDNPVLVEVTLKD